MEHDRATTETGAGERRACWVVGKNRVTSCKRAPTNVPGMRGDRTIRGLSAEPALHGGRSQSCAASKASLTLCELSDRFDLADSVVRQKRAALRGTPMLLACQQLGLPAGGDATPRAR
jgi:hypothetical protein